MRAGVVVLILLAALLPGAPRPAPAAEAPVVKEYVYKRTPQGGLNMFVHFPPGWRESDRRPAILFFFGGGWKNGSPSQFLTQAEYLASRGMVAARADYRVLNRHGTTPDRCVEDARSAVRWLRVKAGELGIDPERLAAAGGSAGGHLAAAAALLPGFDAPGEELSAYSPRPNALVLFNPALDLRDRVIEDGEGRDVAAAISPAAFLRRGAPPTVMFFGTEDALLAPAREFSARAASLGLRAELHTAAGMRHGFFNRPPWLQVTLQETDRFLASLGYLEGGPRVEIPAGQEPLKRE